MNVAVVGTGYVGLVAGVCFADAGHHVTCVDVDKKKIDMLNGGEVPIYEPGLEELLAQNKSRLKFTLDIADAVQNNHVIFVAVGTPERADGSADLSITFKVVEAICKFANGEKFIVLKSTVPVGTEKEVTAFCKSNCQFPIEVISNPEFLREGAAIDDFMNPDRVVIGRKSDEAESVMRELYEPFTKNGSPILFMDNTSAEMCKYAANAFLSIKISFINELANLADRIGADIDNVRRGFTSDSRICPAFFSPGVGYGGSCFPKDVKALVHTGQKHGVAMQVVTAADEVNDRQKLLMYDRLKEYFGSLKGKRIALWGLAFKPRTDDVREAPALYLVDALTKAGAEVIAYDPAAVETFRQATKASFIAAPSALAALEGADALLLVTEWNEFRSPELEHMKRALKNPVVFDGRNIWDPAKMKAMGFTYFCVGRQIAAQG